MTVAVTMMANSQARALPSARSDRGASVRSAPLAWTLTAADRHLPLSRW